jgi:hypothetical protein
MPVLPAERVQFALITPDDWDGDPRDVAAALTELAERITGAEDKQVLSSTDQAIARFDGTAGKLQNSAITVSDAALLDTAGGIETPLVRGNQPTAGPGGDLEVQGGDAQDSGSGGDLVLHGGRKIGVGSDGSLKLEDANGNEKLRVYSAGTLLYDDLFCAGYELKTIGNFTTKGDLLSATGASAPARLGVGSNAEILEADSTESIGVKWAVPMQLQPIGFSERLAGKSASHNLRPASCDADFGAHNRVVMPAAGTVVAVSYRMQVATATSGLLNWALYINGVWDSIIIAQDSASGTGYFNNYATGLSVSFSAGDQLSIRVQETGTMVWGPIWGLLWVKMRL